MEQVFNEAVKRFTYGVYAITAAHEGRSNGMIAVWVSQVAKDPTQVVVACQHHLVTTQMIQQNGAYAVNILSRGQEHLVDLLGRTTAEGKDKLAGVRWQVKITGAPVLEGVAAYLDCRVVNTLMTPTHTLFIGEAVAGEVFSGKEPLYYRDGKVLS